MAAFVEAQASASLNFTVPWIVGWSGTGLPPVQVDPLAATTENVAVDDRAVFDAVTAGENGMTPRERPMGHVNGTVPSTTWAAATFAEGIVTVTNVNADI